MYGFANWTKILFKYAAYVTQSFPQTKVECETVRMCTLSQLLSSGTCYGLLSYFNKKDKNM